jgi:hypothetical protein
MNPAAEMQNLAVLFPVHKIQSFDPFPMNGRAMNRILSIHRGCTHAQPHFFAILDLHPNRKLGCVIAAGSGWN